MNDERAERFARIRELSAELARANNRAAEVLKERRKAIRAAVRAGISVADVSRGTGLTFATVEISCATAPGIGRVGNG